MHDVQNKNVLWKKQKQPACFETVSAKHSILNGGSLTGIFLGIYLENQYHSLIH